MADNFQIHTPKSKVAKKLFVTIFLTLIGLFILLFVWKFVSTLWILKYGDSAEKLALTEKVNPSFSLSPEISAQRRAQPSTLNADKLIRPANPVFGEKQAPIKIIAFIDFECPYSQKSYPIFKKIMEEYDGAIEVVFKQFPIESLHPHAMDAALASTCAQEQGKFWEYYTLLFEQKTLDAQSLLNFADELGLKKDQFEQCIATQKYKSTIEQDLTDGINVGVRGTPTFVIDDKKVEGVIEKNLWDQLIVGALQNKK